MDTNVMRAVFTRNFLNYSVKPTNWVFFGGLLFLHVLTAIWPADLSGGVSRSGIFYLTFAYTFFGSILTILTGIWGEQRQRGGAELLPGRFAGDAGTLVQSLAVTLAKYLAAAIIFSLMLLLSLFLSAVVFGWQYWPAYLSFWILGLAVLAVGVSMSFVSRAVFTRNFVAYFASPTGYVFICVFVLLSSVAAFWPNDFFNANLANLDQLNKWFPLIMLIFIPAITMSTWAEEGREGTDELLLTVPAADLDIVLGKYLAAVAIFTLSLLFSLASNFAVLEYLGSPDLGLLSATYVGYWLIGLAMLAVGMVASFLTRNLTVAYIFGALFCAPLVLASEAEVIMGREAAIAVGQWSIAGQFRDFGRGILNFSGLTYYAMIVVMMLYLSMVLIGRRHWIRGRNWYVLGTHYFLRTVAFAALTLGASYFFYHHDLRRDVTDEGLSRLSDESIVLLDELKETLEQRETKQTIQIDAYISPEVPESYLRTRLDLRSKLRELETRFGDLIKVQIHELQRYGKRAVAAKERFGITPAQVTTKSRGTFSSDFIFMGLAVTRGVETVVVPFLDKGVPAEYELTRSLCTVAGQERKRLGVVQTRILQPHWRIIEELKKQYDVSFVDPSGIPKWKKAGDEDGKDEDGKHEDGQDNGEKKEGNGEKDEEKPFDVLLVVQPSSLEQRQMKGLLEAIRSGQPTAIFEDPLPYFFGNYASQIATSAPRELPRNMPPQQLMQMVQMGMLEGMLEKNAIKGLWRLLEIDSFSGDDGVEIPKAQRSRFNRPKWADKCLWQSYDPYPSLPLPKATREMFVVIGRGCGAEEPFNPDHEISSGLQQVMLPCPGYIKEGNSRRIKMEPLLRSGPNSGTVEPFYKGFHPFLEYPVWVRLPEDDLKKRKVSGEGYVMAAHFTGTPKPEDKLEDQSDAETEKDTSKSHEEPEDINVVLVGDIDLLTPTFFFLRDTGGIPQLGLKLELDNVTFILNVLDSLAEDQKFLALRKRRPKHRELTRVTENVEEAQTRNNEARNEEEKKYEEALKEANKQVKKLKEELKAKYKQEDPNIEMDQAEKKADKELEHLVRQVKEKDQKYQEERKKAIEAIEMELDNKIRQLQNRYKLSAVILPPIPPLLVALVVFITRRVREREGVSRERRR